jgi:tetratricopeptide (TPR) repeat protein
MLVSAASLGWAGPASPAAEESFGDGVLVIDVDKDSPYYAAGLRTGDFVIEGNGRTVANDCDFYRVFAATTTTQQITTRVRRDNKPVLLTLPAFLPADVRISAIGADWARYLKYYAPDPNQPEPLLKSGYANFDRRRYSRAQVELTSATLKRYTDPLTLTKVAWLLLRSRSGDVRERADKAGKLLEQARDKFDATRGDLETGAKIDGTLMIYYQILENPSLAAIHGRRAISAAPDLIGNRLNYHQMLMEARRFEDAAIAVNQLVADFPRSIHFLRLKRAANMSANRIADSIDAGETMVMLMPDDIPTRLQLLPQLDRLEDNYRAATNCEYLLNNHALKMSDRQKGSVLYYMARVHYRRGLLRQAESTVRQAIALRGLGDEFCLLGDILHDRRQWKETILAYRDARQKSWIDRPSRNRWRDIQKRSDNAIEHLWSWQIKKMPRDVQKRKEWLEERSVLKHSFVMRNRYEIRNVLIIVGVLMILTGLVLRFFVTSY